MLNEKTCKDCCYYLKKDSTCHRYPPQCGYPCVGGFDGVRSNMEAHFPTVGADNWCGEWKPRPTHEV